jgi:hypothetical protein
MSCSRPGVTLQQRLRIQRNCLLPSGRRQGAFVARIVGMEEVWENGTVRRGKAVSSGVGKWY